MIEKFVGSAVCGPIGNDVIASFQQSKKCGSDGSHTGSCCQTIIAAFNQAHLFFKFVFIRITATRIEVHPLSFTIQHLLVNFFRVLEIGCHVDWLTYRHGARLRWVIDHLAIQ